MTVALPRSELVKIHAHAREAYPEECCGFLIGTQDLRRVVVEARRAANLRSDDRRTRYTIDPRETLRLDRELRGTEREIVGFYHSHPDVPAVPSAFDMDHAWPGYVYVIVSVSHGEPKDVHAWILVETETERSFMEEAIELV